jgi:hypothetical protein
MLGPFDRKLAHELIYSTLAGRIRRERCDSDAASNRGRKADRATLLLLGDLRLSGALRH